MASAENLQTISATAGEALPIYRFVYLQSDGKYDLVDTDDLRADGVTCEEVAADEDLFAMAPCNQPAIGKITLGATLAVGALIAADGGTGKAIAAGAAGADKFTLGVLLEAGDDGDVVRFQMHQLANQV